MGEFALLDTTLDCGKKLNIFAKIQTETEDMDNIARDYQFYVREVMFYQNLSSKLNVKTPKPYYVEQMKSPEGYCFSWSLWMDGITQIK